MFGIGGFELFIILVFGFLIFGPDKLPDIARTVGRAIAKFRSAQDEMNSVIKSTDIYDPNDPDEPFKDPTVALDKLARHQEEKRIANERAKSSSSASGASAKSSSGAETARGQEADSVAEEPAQPRQESFTERKARYERERAARKAAEAKAAHEAAASADASGDDAGQPAAGGNADGESQSAGSVADSAGASGDEGGDS